MSQAPPPTVEVVADFAPTARRPLWPLLAAGLLLALAAIVATLQSPYRDAYGYGERGWLDLLIRPLEINPELRLPRVEGDLIDIAFSADGQTGFAVGGGAILQTDDGGLNWTVAREAVAPRLGPIAVSADGTFAAALAGGAIYIARAGKWELSRVYIPAQGVSEFSDVFSEIKVSSDGTKIQALTPQGNFVWSVDGGVTWVQREFPDRLLTAMAFDDSGRYGWLGTGFGEVLTTTDGGATWTGTDEAVDSALGAEDAAFNLPARSPRAPPQPAASASDPPLLLGVVLSQEQPDETGGDARQYPNALDQGSPRVAGKDGNAPSASTGNSTGTLSGPRAARSITARKTAGGGGTAVQSPAPPVPTLEPAPSDAADKKLEQGGASTAGTIILTLDAVPGLREVAGIRLLDDFEELFIGRNGYQVETRLADLVMSDAATGWAAGGREIWATSNGATWAKQSTAERGEFTAIAAARDGKRAWVTGTGGTLLATIDGGARWFHQLRKPGVADPPGSYWRFPAPWFYLALFGLLGGFLANARRPLPAEPQPGVSAMGITDAPAARLIDDKLQFAPLARGISRYLRNANTQPPLTLAISGEWGSGKSSLMRMVCEDLRSHGNHPVWFNAWHQDEEQLLAALLAAIRDKALPAWLSLDGLRFRAHLFLLRARRKLPATLLLIGIASFFLAVLVLSEPADWTRRARSVARLVPGKGGPESTALGALIIQALTVLAGLFTAVTGIQKALKAFGADPAVLLTSTIDNFKLRDASAQVHFRTHFQRQFDEVTEALPYPLVIVIDDLDRCRPETVLQVMESVNFLMSSGKCFVLFGMSTLRVQAALALSFKDIAQEFVEIGRKEKTPIQPAQREQKERENRLTYAHDYLQKLINLDIRVPAREDIAPHVLLARDSGSEDEDEFAVARRWAGLIGPLLLSAAVAWGAWWTGSHLLDSSPTEPRVQAAATPAPDQSGPIATADDRVRPTPTPTPTPSPPPKDVRVERGQDGGGLWPMMVLLGALLAVVAALQYRRRANDDPVADTDEFTDALKVWTPIVASRSPSPRAIKRFGNRLRYLAMLQQAEDAGPNGGGLLPDWLARWLAANDAGEPPPEPQPKVAVVADHRIVAMGAIHAAFGDEHWREWVSDHLLIPVLESHHPDIAGAIKAYKSGGWGWPPSDDEVRAFERSLKGIRLEGEVAVLDDAGEPPGPASPAAPQPQQQQPKRLQRKEQQ